jgi:hypothetical protein
MIRVKHSCKCAASLLVMLCLPFNSANSKAFYLCLCNLYSNIRSAAAIMVLCFVNNLFYTLFPTEM